MVDTLDDAFITGLRQSGINVTEVSDEGLKSPVRRRLSKITKFDRLDEVRIQHSNLQKVVELFRSKVNVLMDKQRSEFLTAYENHVQEFHKELALLRQRVTEIANDKAREEKVQQLNESKEFYRNEAMALDIETNNLSKTLRSLTARIQKLEKERDWLLKQLRKARNKMRLYQESGDTFNLTEIDHEDVAVYTRHLDEVSPTKKNRKMFKNGKLIYPSTFGVSRDLDHISTIINSKSVSKLRDRVLESYGSLTESLHTKSAPYGIGRELYDSDRKKLTLPPIKVNKSKPVVNGDSQSSSSPIRGYGIDPKEELVKARIKRENIIDFLKSCGDLCYHGSWNKLRQRSISDILKDAEAAVQLCNESTSDIEIEQLRIHLASELTVCPEIYDVLIDIISGKFPELQQTIKTVYERNISEDMLQVLMKLASIDDGDDISNIINDDTDDDGDIDPDAYIASLKEEESQMMNQERSITDNRVHQVS